MRALVALAAIALTSVVDCGRDLGSGALPTSASATASSTRPLAPAHPPTKSPECTLDPTYPGMWELAEASAAVELEPRPGERAILALSDSGNHGEAMIWPLPGGPLRKIHLELDTLASDDTEGAAWVDGHLFTLTSSGAVRRYTPSPAGELVRDRTAYPIGPAPYVCSSLYDGNCGKNYEGLCLRPAAKRSRCAGYAASKKEGALYCVVYVGDALAIDPIKRPIKLDLQRHSLSDCAFGSVGGPADDTLIITTNIYGGSTTYVVDEATGALGAIDIAGLPNNEAIAVDRDGALYQFMDGDTSVSPTYRATCHGWPAPPKPLPLP